MIQIIFWGAFFLGWLEPIEDFFGFHRISKVLLHAYNTITFICNWNQSHHWKSLNHDLDDVPKDKRTSHQTNKQTKPFSVKQAFVWGSLKYMLCRMSEWMCPSNLIIYESLEPKTLVVYLYPSLLRLSKHAFPNRLFLILFHAAIPQLAQFLLNLPRLSTFHSSLHIPYKDQIHSSLLDLTTSTFNFCTNIPSNDSAADALRTWSKEHRTQWEALVDV